MNHEKENEQLRKENGNLKGVTKQMYTWQKEMAANIELIKNELAKAIQAKNERN